MVNKILNKNLNKITARFFCLFNTTCKITSISNGFKPLIGLSLFNSRSTYDEQSALVIITYTGRKWEITKRIDNHSEIPGRSLQYRNSIDDFRPPLEY